MSKEGFNKEWTEDANPEDCRSGSRPTCMSDYVDISYSLRGSGIGDERFHWDSHNGLSCSDVKQIFNSAELLKKLFLNGKPCSSDEACSQFEKNRAVGVSFKNLIENFTRFPLVGREALARKDCKSFEVAGTSHYLPCHDSSNEYQVIHTPVRSFFYDRWPDVDEVTRIVVDAIVYKIENVLTQGGKRIDPYCFFVKDECMSNLIVDSECMRMRERALRVCNKSGKALFDPKNSYPFQLIEVGDLKETTVFSKFLKQVPAIARDIVSGLDTPASEAKSDKLIGYVSESSINPHYCRRFYNIVGRKERLIDDMDALLWNGQESVMQDGQMEVAVKLTELLLKSLVSPQGVVVLKGAPGIGKTTLLSRLGRLVAARFGTELSDDRSGVHKMNTVSMVSGDDLDARGYSSDFECGPIVIIDEVQGAIKKSERGFKRGGIGALLDQSRLSTVFITTNNDRLVKDSELKEHKVTEITMPGTNYAHGRVKSGGKTVEVQTFPFD